MIVMKCLATWAGRRFSRRTLLIPCIWSTPSSSPLSLSLQSHSILETWSWCLVIRDSSSPSPSRTVRLDIWSSGDSEEVRQRQNRIIMKTFTRWWTVRNMLSDINNSKVRQTLIYKRNIETVKGRLPSLCIRYLT